ncbi:hypothetical protein C8J56DRAFT_958446 [Mycena floridula]|nr:hypothetical protein C8J56DRAFT_958446 [Mycena floridula]
MPAASTLRCLFLLLSTIICFRGPASCPCLAAVVSGALAGCCLSTTVHVSPDGGFGLANFSQNGSFYFQRCVTISISFHLSWSSFVMLVPVTRSFISTEQIRVESNSFIPFSLPPQRDSSL